MTRFPRSYRHLALAVCLAGPLLATAEASADSTLACSALSANAHEPHRTMPMEVFKTQELYRFQDRPYLRIPEGVALWVRAPRGITAADLHNLLRDCARQAVDTKSAVCVPGARLSVDRRGGSYVVRITSNERSTALEIQRRARERS